MQPLMHTCEGDCWRCCCSSCCVAASFFSWFCSCCWRSLFTCGRIDLVSALVKSFTPASSTYHRSTSELEVLT